MHVYICTLLGVTMHAESLTSQCQVTSSLHFQAMSGKVTASGAVGGMSNVHLHMISIINQSLCNTVYT